jgi:2-octaprenylphenol hydroxylase
MALDEVGFCQSLEIAFEHRLGPILAADQRLCIPLRQRHAKQYAKPGMVLLGDAAHTIHPLAGQGVNLGLLDVAALVEVLSNAYRRGADFASLAVLQRYQRRRQRENLQMMALMEAFVRLYGTQNIWAVWLRNMGMGAMQKLPVVKHRLVQRAMGLGPDLPPLAQPPLAVP